MSALARVYDFQERMEFTRGQREQADTDMLKRIIIGAKDVRKTTTAEDRTGVDYVVTLRRDAQVLVDAKTRTPGCARFWKQGPELALEKWSVKPINSADSGKTGWTLSEQSPVDLILFTFHPSDSERVFLLPFQLLRVAFRRNLDAWFRTYKEDTQSSISNGRRWQSQAVFVPALVVLNAIHDVMEGQS